VTITTLSPELTRPYLIKVRPLHRENLDSYSARLLQANLETDDHKQHLLRRAAATAAGAADGERWTRIVTTKARLSPWHFTRARQSGLHHDDLSSCPACTSGLEARWMCELCAHGETVHQYPHLETIVCLTHQRWAGPDTSPAQQRPVGAEHLAAERQFRRLRRASVLDTTLFLVLREAFRARHLNQSPDSDDLHLIDFAAYPVLVRAAAALVDWEFMRRLFNPIQPYAAAYATLRARIAEAIGSDSDGVARAIWLYLRPTFLSIREHVVTGEPYVRAWAHDFPLPASIIRTFTRPAERPEPFRAYLHASDDYVLTEASWEAVLVHHLNPPKHPGTGKRAEDDFQSICRDGHRITLLTGTDHKYRGPKTDACRVCSHRLVLSGYNDIVTLYPTVASEFHPEDNDGADPRQILAGSATTYLWRCNNEGHKYPATPSNRTGRKSGCPTCINRNFVPGVNDILTKCPSLAPEWHPTLNALRCDQVSIGSPNKAWWICRFGHVWEALIASRVRGVGCKTCGARKSRSGRISFATVHPELVPEWDTALNGRTTPDDIAANSNISTFWRCPKKNHSYAQTPDKRANGAGCPFCSRRKVALEETDAVTLYPLITVDWNCAKNAGIDPRQILPGTKLYFWLCRYGHDTRQSIPHRVKSKGCVLCSPAFRSGATTSK
jgi:hypothetical protein